MSPPSYCCITCGRRPLWGFGRRSGCCMGPIHEDPHVDQQAVMP